MTNDGESGLNARLHLSLTFLALAVFLLTLLVRIFHCQEVPANIAYELEAAYRTLMGQCPYRDFYFDQGLPVIFLRMSALLTAPLIALFSLHNPALSSCFGDTRITGLASVLNTAALSILSFYLCYKVMASWGRAVFSAEHRAVLLLAIAVANLSMSFEFGNQQHLFMLLFMPYLLARWIEQQDQKVPGRFIVFVAVLAALGAVLNPLFAPVVIAFELIEVLARRRASLIIKKGPGVFVVTSILLWLNLLLLPKGAAQALYSWILPVKFNFLTHDSFSFYGLMSSPECRILFYLFVFAVIFAGGAVRHFAFFRPLASVAIAGFVIWLLLVLGLSSDGLILKFLNAMLLTIEAYFTINWFTRRYPRLFRRKKELACLGLALAGSLACCITLIAGEDHQRQLIKTGQARLHPPSYADLQDLAKAIIENSSPHDRILLINGKLRPAYPLLMQLERKSCGYFLGTEALGTLSDIRLLCHWDDAHGTSEARTAKLEESLYERLASDIRIEKPELICIEQGDMDAAVRLFKVQPLLTELYDSIREASFYADRVGLREITEFNYNYAIYKIKKDHPAEP